MKKIKDGDEFKLFGHKLIARKSCLKNKIFIVDDNCFISMCSDKEWNAYKTRMNQLIKHEGEITNSLLGK